MMTQDNYALQERLRTRQTIKKLWIAFFSVMGIALALLMAAFAIRTENDPESTLSLISTGLFMLSYFGYFGGEKIIVCMLAYQKGRFYGKQDAWVYSVLALFFGLLAVWVVDLTNADKWKVGYHDDQGRYHGE
ncbi:hypothetical protein [Armatimonas sp.]|uniref:hypothetical protein n=1 Tax=Armatimonas sp. TaxID=1872638 RepID=UPI00286D219B|nr:hypothetical protein [Armatimonas sp.]